MTWFVATAIKQEPTRSLALAKRIDPAGLLVPDWRFFAPNPGIHDIHLLFRDELEDGTPTQWTEISVWPTRRFIHMIWHPDRRLQKAIFDAGKEIDITVSYLKAQEDFDARPIQNSPGYLALLNHVANACDHHPNAAKTQFLIAQSDGTHEKEPPTLVFLSNFHCLASQRTR
ncbi:hypothetical protein ACFY19_34620 [Streptosporangium saharense]|uniref:hypothetical protein n=1 Tax=Streptosporangium saharense TaxID=1706840 RepID=UPI003689ACE0